MREREEMTDFESQGARIICIVLPREESAQWGIVLGSTFLCGSSYIVPLALTAYSLPKAGVQRE